MTKQYINLAKRILEEGVMTENKRTGTKALTVINADLEYDVGKGEFPLVTTRKAPTKLAIAELLGYIRGYSNAEDFRNLGTKSWDMNANQNESWLKNPLRSGEDDMGRVYGVQGRSWNTFHVINEFDYTLEEEEDVEEFLVNTGFRFITAGDTTYELFFERNFDQLHKVYTNLRNGIDDRGEIVTYWNPGEFYRGCLRPCLHSFQFSLLGDTLYLNATQRSCDVPLGLVANMQQCYWFLAAMAQITGHKAGKVFHKIVNAHIYENQIELMKEQVQRDVIECDITATINPEIKTLEDLEKATTSDFIITGYEHHESIQYPFSV